MTIPLFDAHCDTGTVMLDTGSSLRKNGAHLDITRAMKFAPYAQVFAIWAMPGRKRIFEDTIEVLKRSFSECEDVITLCRSAEDAVRAAAAGKAAAFISLEGADAIDCDIKRLRSAYDDGLRIVHLCWNFDNALCGAAMDSGGGLTDMGRDFIEAAWDLGVLIDMSHISEAAFWDVIKLAKRPVIAGHSNSKALCDHARNITDEQFKAIAGLHGCVGVNLCPDFLGLNRDIGAIAEHIEHFLALGGEEAVCIGADWDGVDELPTGITGIQDMDKLYELLLRRGYSEGLVRDVFYNNLMRLIERGLGHDANAGRI